MKHKHSLEERYHSYLYNHLWLKFTVDYGTAFLASVVSAAIFAFGIVCFMNPTLTGGQTTLELVSGGSSGLAQVIASLLRVCGVNIEPGNTLFFSIAYLIVNTPLIVLAFKGIGIRFATFTLINVGFVFLFSNIFKGQFFQEVATVINNHGGFLSRALFAGMCTGLSSAVAYKFETSAGGFDIVSYYVSLRKSTTAGKYSVAINAVIIFLFYLIYGLGGANANSGDFAGYSTWAIAISCVFFSVVYLFTVMLVVDAINVRNKKVQIEINTTNTDLPKMLLARIPHGVTVVKAKGGYSGQDRLLIYIVVSSLEVKSAIKLVKEVDPTSFVTVKSLIQVYGRFFSQKIR